MRHRIFTLVAAFSVVALLATCYLWIHSHLGVDPFTGSVLEFRVSIANRNYNVESNPGLLQLSSLPPWQGKLSRLSDTQFMGVRLVRATINRQPCVWLFIPFWLLVLATAPLPCLWLGCYRVRDLHRRRFAAGLCLSCGYDLRSSPDRCPECGTPASPAGRPATTMPA